VRNNGQIARRGEQPRKYRFLFVAAMILGKNTALQNLRSAISAMPEVEATWVTIGTKPEDIIARAPLVSRNHSLMFGLVARTRVRALLRAGNEYDAAFFNHILPAVFLRHFRRTVPCVDSMDTTPIGLLRHGQPYYTKLRSEGASVVRGFKNRLARSIFTDAAFLLPYSQFTRDSLLHDYQIPDRKIVVVAPGVSLTMWPGRSPDSLAGVSRTAPVRVLFVGGDFLRKGGDLLLQVARRDEFRKHEFHFVTSGLPGGRQDNVVFHDGVTANSGGMLDLYRSADIFAMPTRADFSPTNAICEAMAMELPVIATGVGGLDEIVVDGQTGFIVRTNDADDIADRLRSLIDDPGRRLRLGRNARAMVEARFNIETNARVIVDCLKRAADAKAASILRPTRGVHGNALVEEKAGGKPGRHAHRIVS